jgi:hypothetical protein
MKHQLDMLLQKKMTRKEFLATLGLGVASIFGITSLLRLLTDQNRSSNANSPRGYGSSTYGK